MVKRRKTRQIRVGSVRIGGGAPIAVQSMAKVPTKDAAAVVRQAKRLEAAGCDILRVAVRDAADAGAIRAIRRGTKMPLVADIHFDYRLALAAIKAGCDKVRLNPGNIGKRSEIAEVVRAAKRARIPIRVGLNSGSTGTSLSGSALRYIKLLEELGFRDIIVSLKASDVATTAAEYKRFSAMSDYPLHLGVTAAGPHDSGVIKSAIGIGALLLDGIGDTIRVSLTADPVEEVTAAKNILASLGLGKPAPEIISCPTCGRCRVDLGAIVKELEQKIVSGKKVKGKEVTIAVMGCEVNGPGEAMAADIGIAAGKGSGVLFRNGKIIKRVKEKDFVKTLLEEFKKI